MADSVQEDTFEKKMKQLLRTTNDPIQMKPHIDTIESILEFNSVKQAWKGSARFNVCWNNLPAFDGSYITFGYRMKNGEPELYVTIHLTNKLDPEKYIAFEISVKDMNHFYLKPVRDWLNQNSYCQR